MRKKLLSWLLVLSMVLSMIPATVLPVRAAEPKGTDTGGVTLGAITASYDVSAQSADIEITAGGTYELTGSSTERSVIVKTTDPVTLVLNNLTMERDKSPIQLQDGANVTLVLKAGTTNSITCNATTVTVTYEEQDPNWTDPGPNEDGSPATPDMITVHGNDGMTAGINVPETATLTIDKVKDETAGALTVQGGYGGAGIGGGAAIPGYTDEVGATGANGQNGRNGAGKGSVTQGGYGGAGGVGAAGGLFGKNAENAGTVVINAGALTVTGGKNAAGIGGGRGADGQTATASGTPGSNAYGGYYNASVGNTTFSGGGGGSGGNGGNGGNGGTGGSLKALTITGGTVKVTGGEEATGIGGGNGGTGGNGGPGGAGGAGNNGGGSTPRFDHGGRGGNGATGAVGFKGASPGGNGGTVKITGGRVEITGYVAVGAGRTLWPSRPTYNLNHNGGYNSGRKGSGANGGTGGYNNANTRPEPTADNGSLTIQNASVKLNNTVPADELKLEFPSQAENFSNGGNRDLTQPNNYVRPMNGKVVNEPIYHLALTVKRLDQVTICPDADINLVLYRGDNAKQYTYTTTTGADGVAHLWLPAIAKKGDTGNVEADYNMYAVGNEIAHRAVGRLMPDTKLGIEVKNDDTSEVTAYVGVDYTAVTTPNNSKVYRSVDSETYELKADDIKGVVKLRIDARTVPEDMNIIKLRWFRESIALDAEYDFYTHGTKKKFDDRFNEIQLDTPGNTGSSNADDVAKKSVEIDMTPEQGEAGKKPRIWELPMKENGRYWVELTYQAGTEAPQMIVKGVKINNIFTSYPLWVRGFWALGDKAYEPMSWLYGDGGTGASWQTKTAKYMRLLGANKQPQTQPYGIPWDLDAYSAEAMRTSDEAYDYATKIIDKTRVFTPTGAIDGYDRVNIYATDILKTLYNAQVGNFSADPDAEKAIALNHGAADQPYELILNADYFSNQTTRYGEKVNGKQLYNKYLVQYLARDGSLNIVLMSGVDEAGEPLYDDIKMFTPHIVDADIRGWERPGSVMTKVEYAKADGVWVDITAQNDDLNADNPTNELRIQTDLEGLKAYFSKIEDVKKVRFTYKKATTNVTIKAYYLPEEGETTEREIEGFVPYPVEATYGKPYTPKGAPTIPGFTYADKSNLKADGTIDVVDPATLPEADRANANVIKYYYVKETGNVTYRAVVKGGGQDGADLPVWSEDKTVERNTAPATAAAGTYTPPELTNYVISNENGANGNETITRKDNDQVATVYDGLHDLYVTYEYVQKTKDITVKAIDVLTTKEIPLDEADKYVKALPTGEYKDINAPNLAAKGYTSVGATTQQCFVDATLGEQTVTFFYKPTENAETTVTLYYMDGANEKTIQVLRNEVAWGSSLKVPAPTIAGYTLDVNQAGLQTETLDGGETKYFVTLNPLRGENGAEATGTSAKILYTKNAPTNVTVKLVDGANTDLSKLLTGWTPTIEVEEGKSATATAPSIPNYKLAAGETVEKTLTWDEIKAAVDANQKPTITFTYEKAEADLITITVNGVTEGGEPLYTHTKDVRKSSTEVSLDIITINSYALKDVKMGENPITADKTGVYKIDPAGTAQRVTATYQDNMTTVTIHGYYKGSQEKVFPDITVKAELGKPYEYPRPVITGYDNADAPNTTPGKLDSVTAGAEITFYYVKAEGNVTYQAQAEGVVLSSKTVTAAVGDTIDKTDEKAAQLFVGGFPYFELTAGSGDATAVTYNGKDDVTVTYTYTRKQHQLTIVKKDVDGEAPIGTEQKLPLPAGKLHTFGADEITGVTGYSAVAALNPKAHAMGDADEQVVFWYRKNVESRYATITVNSVCDENGDHVMEVFQSYQLPALKDVELSVNAPKWIGYTLKDPTQLKKTFKPTGDQTITFEYVLDAPQIFTVELKDNSKPDTPLSAPADYQTRYTLKKGSSVTIQAPAINGYSLVGKSIVTVNYGDPLTDGKLVFNYAPVKTANFVNHTVVFKNHDETIEFYRYSTLVSKSDTETTTYKASTVQNVIAGYKLKDIHMKVEGAASDTTHMTQVIAPNNKNVTIVYRFEEDTSRIVIKKVLSDGKNVEDTILSGYRTGLQDVEVTAPLVDGYALASDQPLTKKISELVSGNNEIFFNYVPVENVIFSLMESNEATGQDEVIVVRNGVANAEYNPKKDGNPLNLSADKYTFLANAKATPPFDQETGKIDRLDTTQPMEYKVYYTKGTRPVQFVAIDSAKLTQDAFATATPEQIREATIETRDVSEHARVGEMYKASAQSVDRYALDDQITKYYPVEESQDALSVYFWYRAKKAGTVTVHYHTGLTADNHDKAALLMSYSLDAVVGEKVIIKLPEYLMDGKYKLPAGEAKERTKVVAEGDNNVVDINYDPNFVTVNVMTKRSDFNDAAEYESREVILTDTQGNHTGNLTLTPPYRAGYTLVGIDGVTGGGVDKFPASYQDGKLTLSGLTANTTITYYYSKTSATEYQSDVTVQYKYGKYDLESQKVQSFNRDVESSVKIPEFDGYVAKQYQFTDGANAGDKQDIAGAVNIRPTAEKGGLVIFYARKDNSAVVPGEDMKLPTTDDVVIKPNGTNVPTVNDDGSVKVPNGGEVVVPGVGVIVPPNGSIVKEDGTIVAPGGVTVDPAKPGETTGYISVTYHANGGVGESYTQMAKNPGSITLIAVAGLFEKTGFKGTGWNTNDKGLGEPYAPNSTTDKSLVLYAQWEEDPTTDPNKYQGTIVLAPNNGTTGAEVTIHVSSDTANPILHRLPANTFALEGWKFAYWLDNNNGGIVPDKAIVEVAHEATLNLTAQWFSEKADGSITVPGANGVPNDTDDVTAKPGAGEDGSLKRDPDTGVITVPSGGSVIDKDGTEIAMPNGGTLKPDGTITIKQPEGPDIVVKPGGTTEPGEGGKQDLCLTYHSNEGGIADVKVYFKEGTTVQVKADAMTREGYKLGQWLNGGTPVAFGDGISTTTTLTAKWYKVNDDGSVTVPGKDGEVESPKDQDNVTVKPGKDGKTPDVDNDGKVTVPDNGNGTGTVVTPDGELVVPGGSKVDPDGTITAPAPDNTKLYPTKGEDGRDETPEGYIKITYTAGIPGIQNVIELVKGTSATVADNPFKVENKTFIGWDNAEVGGTVTTDTVLAAQWKETGSVILAWAAGSKVQEGVNQNEYKLVMRGEWATTDTDKTDKTYTIPVLVDGKPAADGDLRWYVDAASYKNEFGFKGRLTGDDIVSVDAQSGEITVKNSGIVRIYCESKTNPAIRRSVVVIVPGDITKDGSIEMDDITLLLQIIDGEFTPAYDPDDAKTWYLLDLANMILDASIQMDDITEILKIIDTEQNI